MKKTILVAALAVGMCLPVYAAQYTNSEADRYESPIILDENKENLANQSVEPKKSTKMEKEASQPLPIKLSADHAEYDNTSGDFHVSGNVVITQGKETLLTTYAYGNMKTGDVWLEKGGTLVEPKSKMTGQWGHYNFNTKTGEIKEITGSSMKDIYDAPHATIYPDKIVVDEGGRSSRCPSVKHPPCLSVTAKTFEIYPKEKMIARDVKVFIRGKHVYSRDIWVNNFNDEGKTKIMPRFGYDGSDNGAYVALEVGQPLTEKTFANVDLYEYSKAGFKPSFKLDHDERNFHISYLNGWDEDDDVWYKKQNTWVITYKNHHIVDGLPLSYSAYYEYGLWNTWDSDSKKSGPKSWHKEYAVYLNHDPIYLFNTKNTVLNLTVGKKWVNESLSGDTLSTDMYYATLGQKLSPQWNTWVGYYREEITSTLFDIGQPDMARELRNGLQWVPDSKNTVSVINRYDLGKHNNYETDYRWLHKFCCWALEFTYEQEHFDGGDKTLKVMYYFYNL